MKPIRLALILTFLCLNAANLYAQSGPRLVIPADQALNFTVQDTLGDDLKTQQQLIAELKFLRKENTGLKDEVAAQKGELAVKDRIIKIEVERGDFYKDAATKGIKVGDNSVLIEEKYREQISMFKDENGRLRNENDKLRTSRNWRTLFGAVAGAGLGAYVGHQACR